MRRAIGAMEAEAPADRPGDCGEALAMAPEAGEVVVTNAFDAGNEDLFALFDPLEADASVERQVFLGRIGDLQHMALEPGGGEVSDCRVDRVERREEVADQHELAGARQGFERRQAVRFGQLQADQLDHPRQRDAPVHRRDAAAEQGQAFAATDQKAGERDEQEFGAIAFCWPFRAGEVIRRAVVHRGGGVAPQPDTLCSFPLGFADIEALRLGTLAPIDARCRVALLVLAELPEGLALADAAATMDPLRDGHRDPIGRDKERRQHRSGLLRPIAYPGRRRLAPGQYRCPRPRFGRNHRNGAEICSMTRATVMPSARPAKLTAMRWRNTGGASARISSIDGLNRPSISARARQASISA